MKKTISPEIDFIKKVEKAFMLYCLIVLLAEYIDHEEREGIIDQIKATLRYPNDVL